MAITYINRSGALAVYVWEITEDVDVLYRKAELTPEECEQYKAFRAESRKRQWLAVRACLNKVLTKKTLIAYDADGRPSIENDTLHISISHADDFVAILLGKGKMIGVDIESISRNYKRIMQKYVGVGESEVFVEKGIQENLYLPIIWGAKEAAFKGALRCEVDFIRDIKVLNVDANDMHADGSVKLAMVPIAKQGKFRFSTLNNHILVWGEFDDI